MYNEIITFYSKNPPNRWILKDYTVTRTQENLACWDDIEVYIKIDSDKIIDFSFEWDTSIISTACASIFWESIIGMNIYDVLNLKYSYIEKLVWMEISPRRKNASVLWMIVTQNAIHEYLKDWKILDFDDLMDKNND